MTNTITPNLWFDGNAREAVEFYINAFGNGKITGGSTYPKSQSEGLADFQKDLAGKDLVVQFELGEQEFVAINAGPEFTFNPSISFFVNFDPSRDSQAKAHLDALWGKLSDGGTALMPLQEYPFSKYYGWVQDRYGLSWQLILTNPEGEPRPFIVPSLMFGAGNVNKAEEAATYYLSVFHGDKMGTAARYGEQTGPAKAGALMYGDLRIGNMWLAVMDAGQDQDSTFSEALSFSVACRDQDEIDYFWDKLSAVPAAEQCGWCKDKFGVSWQIVPANMEELVQHPQAFARLMEMKKIVVADF